MIVVIVVALAAAAAAAAAAAVVVAAAVAAAAAAAAAVVIVIVATILAVMRRKRICALEKENALEIEEDVEHLKYTIKDAMHAMVNTASTHVGKKEERNKMLPVLEGRILTTY
jgi:hypothetical protein